jgi:hypothetical protein
LDYFAAVTGSGMDKARQMAVTRGRCIEILTEFLGAVFALTIMSETLECMSLMGMLLAAIIFAAIALYSISEPISYNPLPSLWMGAVEDQTSLAPVVPKSALLFLNAIFNLGAANFRILIPPHKPIFP